MSWLLIGVNMDLLKIEEIKDRTSTCARIMGHGCWSKRPLNTLDAPGPPINLSIAPRGQTTTWLCQPHEAASRSRKQIHRTTSSLSLIRAISRPLT